MKIIINGKTAILRFKFVSENYRRYFKPPPLCFLQENIGRVA